MHEATNRRPIETTLWELANTIHEVTSSEDEAFAVLEAMLNEDRISVLSVAPACAA
jgi:hypothetical protein